MANRPKGSNLYSHVVQVCLTSEMKAKVKRLAEINDSTPSAVIRQLIEQGLTDGYRRSADDYIARLIMEGNPGMRRD